MSAAIATEIDLSQPGEYRAQLERCYLFASLLVEMPLAEMSEAIGRAETTGPLFNPTLWIQKEKALGQDKEIVGALLAAQNRIKRARREAR